MKIVNFIFCCILAGTSLGSTCKLAIVTCPAGKTTYPVTCSLSCPRDYSIKGASTVTCQTSGQWSSYAASYCRRNNDPPTQVRWLLAAGLRPLYQLSNEAFFCFVLINTTSTTVLANPELFLFIRFFCLDLPVLRKTSHVVLRLVHSLLWILILMTAIHTVL